MAAKRGKIVSMAEGLLKDLTVRLERQKAQIRARVAHPFHIVKNLFGHKKVSYKGLAKNRVRMYSLFALAQVGPRTALPAGCLNRSMEVFLALVACADHEH